MKSYEEVLETFKTSVSTPPGRARNYMKEQINGTSNILPYSCKLRVYKNDLTDELIRTSKDLRWGAGVKLILDDFQKKEPAKNKIKWQFYLPESHLDYENITAHQKQFLASEAEWKEHYENENIVPIFVCDSMDVCNDDHESPIEESWKDFYYWVVNGFSDDSIIVDLSNLRPYGATNSVGLTATGAVGNGTEGSNTASFLAIYEYLAIYAQDPSIFNFLKLFGVLNNTIRRGGLYKNGIVTSSMWYENQNINEYLDCPLTEISGSHKKGIGFDKEILQNQTLVNNILQKVKSESLFLEKRNLSDDTFPNVCEALFVPDNGTCLIWRVNLGAAKTNQDIIAGYKDVARKLTNLHISWRKDNPEKAQYSTPLELDDQIGLDIMGLANLLRIRGIQYKHFIRGLAAYNNGESVLGDEIYSLISTLDYAMQSAIEVSDRIMIENGLKPSDRIFCVEPAQSHSYETFDCEGFTTCRGIWPPVGRKVARKSDTVSQKIYRHGAVETISELTEDEYELLNEEFQVFLDASGRGHGISYDLRREPTQDWFESFIDGPLKTKYYTEITSTDQSYLKKTAGLAR